MKIKWGIIGAGAIANAFAHGIKQSSTGELIAIGSREKSKADNFAKQWNIPRAYASYQELLNDQEIDAVYICTPHPLHAEWTIAALNSGKHVLCEKPFTLNYPEADKAFSVAKENSKMLMEAFMYRCHPQTAELVKLIKNKIIGEIRLIQASFGFHASFNPESRLFNNELGGGGIMDVGCYPVSAARLIAGASLGKNIAEPSQVKAVAKFAPTGVDEWSAAVAHFENGIIAELATAVSLRLENNVKIFGTEGKIIVPNPWCADRSNPVNGKIIVEKYNSSSEEIIVQANKTSFAYEIDFFGEAVLSGSYQPQYPAMSPEDTIGNMKALDKWRRSIDFTFNREKSENYIHTITGKPLQVRNDNNMKYAFIKGLEKKISRLVIGVDWPHHMPELAIMFDEWIERGGNAFDTAHIYGGGNCEKVFGQWIQNRRIRDQIVIIGKGAHTPNCTPEFLSKELIISLERMKTDYVDIYFMHRDNPEIPVGEFIDVLNEHVKKGHIKIFGGSNWTLERVKKANKYAERKSLQGFSAVSNNFSLARMINPPWDGCIQTADKKSIQWFKKYQMPLFAWSSQARGFFVDGISSPEKKEDKTLVHCWYSVDNFERLARAKALAAEKKCLTINIALAYVLNQPFPTFPLIGPRSIQEMLIAIKGLDINLNERELKWLNLEINKK
ncbi:MAG TPA: aldo/keto reductase [Victivallales bacterium]|nr:aldo/keto reductase [Victivallales bacterium]